MWLKIIALIISDAKSVYRTVVNNSNKACLMKANNHITIIRSFVAIGVACAISGAWAANVPAGTELAAKQELVRNNGSEPASLDPHKVESSVESSIISDFFEGLVEVRNDGSI